MGGASDAAQLIFPEHDRNAESLKQKFYSIAKKGPPTGSPNCPEYVRYAKAIMKKIAIETDGSTGSGGAGEMSENFDSEFGDADDDDEDKNEEENGIGSEDSGLERNKDNSFFEFTSKQSAPENKVFGNNLKASNNDPIPIVTTIIAGSGSGSVVAGSGSAYSSPATDPQLVKQKTYAFSRQFSHRRKKVKLGDESVLDKMISMMGMQMQQDFAMRRDEMKNERELRRQELAMQQQILQSQQQMMNMFMMTMMGRNNILQNKEKNQGKDNHNNNEDSNVDSDWFKDILNEI